jgi:putative permease
MLDVLKRWYQTRFSDPDAVTLFLLLVFCFAVLWLFGDLLAPLLVALVMAYLLEWPVSRLQRAASLAPSPPAWSCCCSSR